MTPKVNAMYEAHDVQADMPKEKQEEQAKLILCFDGTGNQFSGDTSDTNVVKLYQKFNRKTPNQYHYYQRKSGFRVPVCNQRSIHLSKPITRLSRVSINDQSFKLSLLTSVSPQLELEPTQRMPHPSTLDYGVASSAAGPRHWTKGSAQPLTSMLLPATVSQ